MDREEHSMKINNLKKPGLFAAGVLFGTAGIKILTSKDAKKLYTNCTAAVSYTHLTLPTNSRV